MKRFALLPIVICGEGRWLEWCYIEQSRDAEQRWCNREFTFDFFYEEYMKKSDSFGNVVRRMLIKRNEKKVESA